MAVHEAGGLPACQLGKAGSQLPVFLLQQSFTHIIHTIDHPPNVVNRERSAANKESPCCCFPALCQIRH